MQVTRAHAAKGSGGVGHRRQFRPEVGASHQRFEFLVGKNHAASFVDSCVLGDAHLASNVLGDLFFAPQLVQHRRDIDLEVHDGAAAAPVTLASLERLEHMRRTDGVDRHVAKRREGPSR
ncbi:MAG: hypothetical protein ABUL60_21105 [Myxococcales bacterium]